MDKAPEEGSRLGTSTRGRGRGEKAGDEDLNMRNSAKFREECRRLWVIVGVYRRFIGDVLG